MQLIPLKNNNSAVMKLVVVLDILLSVPVWVCFTDLFSVNIFTTCHLPQLLTNSYMLIENINHRAEKRNAVTVNQCSCVNTFPTKHIYYCSLVESGQNSVSPDKYNKRNPRQTAAHPPL